MPAQKKFVKGQKIDLRDIVANTKQNIPDRPVEREDGESMRQRSNMLLCSFSDSRAELS